MFLLLLLDARRCGWRRLARRAGRLGAILLRLRHALLLLLLLQVVGRRDGRHHVVLRLAGLLGRVVEV